MNQLHKPNDSTSFELFPFLPFSMIDIRYLVLLYFLMRMLQYKRDCFSLVVKQTKDKINKYRKKIVLHQNLRKKIE